LTLIDTGVVGSGPEIAAAIRRLGFETQDRVTSTKTMPAQRPTSVAGAP
jgi:hypothetical protein